MPARQAMGGGAVPFECQCARNFGGGRCETDLCAGVDCGQYGECVAGVCECSDGWSGDRCEIFFVPQHLMVAGISAKQYRDGLAAGVDGSADMVCFGEYITVNDPSVALDAPSSCWEGAGLDYSGSAPCRCDSDAGGGPFGLGHGGAEWYRIAPPAGTTLPMVPITSGHGGTLMPSWLSGWSGPHVTGGCYGGPADYGCQAGDDGGPPAYYTTPGTLPRVSDGACTTCTYTSSCSRVRKSAY
eukprot:SAG11_NODE_706_length_7651_cov_4.192399_9_plen_242_part_00